MHVNFLITACQRAVCFVREPPQAPLHALLATEFQNTVLDKMTMQGSRPTSLSLSTDLIGYTVSTVSRGSQG